eukprot:CAMPEP_0184504796 /NCGR_PEP_ID=MMETSP0113_2-20130426/52649_1 /TAXON_ID=91329 /ORGANISM="Norrisiella sphaerica, Strain BC52" /LENGTH=175 /DNA_ID=CAMNT_0026894455 /DNA_START=1032 /DNA_END=1556 /DNA_ORIENTATION=-
MARTSFSDIFHDVERVNDRVSFLALAAVLLGAAELASIVQTVFDDGSVVDRAKKEVFAAADMFRLMVCISLVILQFTFAAADIAHASERLAEKCALLAVTARQKAAERNIALRSGYGTMQESHRISKLTDNDGKEGDGKKSSALSNMSVTMDVAEVADLLGSWARNHPVRVSVVW